MTNCKHEWERKNIFTNQSIVFVEYECEHCGKTTKQCIGETWKPDENGKF